jgi:hypothetical protein
MRLLLSVAAMSVAGQACNKTVVSDKVVPVKTPDTSPTQNNGTIEGQTPDTKSKIRISKASCDAERKTEFQVKVQGLIGTDWIRLSCDDIKSGKEFEVDSKKGYCNVLQLKTDVTFDKSPFTPEKYTRTTSNPSDKFFFKLEAVGGSSSTSALKIRFEDTNDDFWNEVYLICKNTSDKLWEQTQITLSKLQYEKTWTCDEFMNGRKKQDGTRWPTIVDFDDFVFSIESNDVQFAVENQPEIGCKPGQ